MVQKKFRKVVVWADNFSGPDFYAVNFLTFILLWLTCLLWFPFYYWFVEMPEMRDELRKVYWEEIK
jgi:hypothetical protein